jgi:exosortase
VALARDFRCVLTKLRSFAGLLENKSDKFCMGFDKDFRPSGWFTYLLIFLSSCLHALNCITERLIDVVEKRITYRHTKHLSGKKRAHSDSLWLGLVALGLIAVTTWSYWNDITGLFRVWQSSDDYSAGQLVPLVAIFLLWRERKKLAECTLKPFWPALGLLLLAVAARAYGLLFMFESVERYSMVLTIAALVLMVAGWQVFRTVFWILLILFLMVPFPGRIHNMISGPLQTMATTGAVFVLEAFVRVSQQGNVVMLNGKIPMAVVEACSGLRMLTAFIIVAAFMAYMVKRPGWQKVVLLLSSVPIAVVCNILRLCVTAVLFLVASSELAEKFFHDFAGLVMMPAAVLIMFGELWLMDKLTAPEPEPQHVRAKKPAKPAISSITKRSKLGKKQA